MRHHGALADVAVHDGSDWRGIWRIATEPQRTSDEYAVWLLSLLGHAGLDRAAIDQAVIGTVVPAALSGLQVENVGKSAPTVLFT